MTKLDIIYDQKFRFDVFSDKKKINIFIKSQVWEILRRIW